MAWQAATELFVGRSTENPREENFFASTTDALALGRGRELKALRAEVHELKQLVASVAQAVNNNNSIINKPSALSVETFGVLLQAVLLGLAKTVFVVDSRLSVHRTALVLVAYLVVHVLGNLTIFAGRDAFNGYAAFLESLWVVKAVEWCVFAAGSLYDVLRYEPFY